MPARDVVGKTILELVPGFETEWFAVYQRVLDTGVPLRFDSEFKSMQSWFEVDVAKLAGTDRLVIFFKDITESKAIASQLIASTVRQAERLIPDFFFLDIGLPGLNGYEVVKSVRELDGLRQVPVVALTGWGATHDIVHAAEAGFDSHLTKPASLAPIMAMIERCA